MNMPDDVLCDPDKPEHLWVQLDPALHPLWDGLPRSTTWVIDGSRPPVFYHVSEEAARLVA